MLTRRADSALPEVASVATVVLTVLVASAYLAVDDVSTRVALSHLSIALSTLGLGLACSLVPAPYVRPVLALLVGTVLIGVGELVATRERSGGVAPYPHGGEGWAGAGTLLLLLGVLLLVGRRGAVTPQERLDVGIGTVSLLLFATSSGLLTSLGVGPGALLSGAFLATAVLPVVIGVLVVSRPETSRAGMWLVVASLGLIGADAGFVVATAGGSDADGRTSDVGYLVARGALVAMALSLARGRATTENEVARRRVLLTGAFALLVPAGLLVGADTGVQNPVWLTVLCGTAPVALLTWRAVRSVDDLALVAGLDPLTGLGNRRAFDHRLSAACDGGQEFCLLVADLDGFKHVNDTWGHGAGDRVLVDVAAGLRRAAPGAFVARLGGDEFAVLLHGPGDPGPAREQLLSTLTPVLAAHPGLGISVGAVPGRTGSTPDEVLAAADAAMYADKRAAR
ncbi:diguanylate cyclase domain-containing protein [Aquipuribacter sp. MA13-6]|uniref:GGDEF domain-containing protein n=1 Tax=unclassified Aquipuribacter TaxID=2635084 RepID=UPI003EEB1C49